MKKVKNIKIEVDIEYVGDKIPFHNQQMVSKILAALRKELKIMEEDGCFGRFQGFRVKTKVKAKKPELID
ncbi:unnamed protein product [marine sediment metagenome]|uniref:Uncharacterized protein n=1 Tax=marine sediment metagenome TaxID=412755 RepID=X1EHB3_9ZZZZ